MSIRRRIAHTHSTGLTRREILQVGYSGAMGLALPALFANRAQAAAADDDAGLALAGVPEGIDEVLYVVVEDADAVDVAAQAGDLLAHPEGIGVLDLAHEQFGADGVDFDGR